MLNLKLWFAFGAFCCLAEFPLFWGQVREQDPEDHLSLALILSAFSILCWLVVLYFWIRRISWIIWPPKEAQATDKGAGR